MLSTWSFSYVRLAAVAQFAPKYALCGIYNSHSSASTCMQACSHLKILHGLCNALYLELSLTEFCKSVLVLCTDPAVTELQLSQRVFTWLDPQHEVAALNILCSLHSPSDSLDIRLS